MMSPANQMPVPATHAGAVLVEGPLEEIDEGMGTMDDLEAMEAEEEAARQALRIEEGIRAFAGTLQRKCDDYVARRRTIEERMLEDLRQYHGVYDPTLQAKLKEQERSSIYMPLTRSATWRWAARLSDMLFPTDDRNWSIAATPVPELAGALRTPAPPAAPATAEGGQPAQISPEQQAAAAARQHMEEAKARADAMADEIEDQLTECNYNAISRQVIDDAVKLGTGIKKGPIAYYDTRSSWHPVTVDPATGARKWGMVERKDPRPKFYRVSPWDFFPDPDATCIQDCDDSFERHLLGDRQMRQWAKRPDMNKAAIGRLLAGNFKRALPQEYTQLREISGKGGPTGTEQKFIVWEYNGSVPLKDLLNIALGTGDRAFIDLMADEDETRDVQACIIFCEGEVLKFDLHGLDSGEPIYSVFSFVKDEASLWGYGVPSIMSGEQSALNAAWRMMMDNSGIAAGPQIVIDKSRLTPVDGNYSLRPFKSWEAQNMGATTERPPMYAIEFNSHQAELANIINLAMNFADVTTAQPAVAQGEAGATAQQNTFGGLSLLMNSANVVFRMVAKNHDDMVTVPDIRRIYDWNMQFSARDEIKGDYQVDARGSSALLAREMQTSNLIAITNIFGDDPRFKKLEAMRRTVQSLQIPADELVMSDDEIAEEEQKQAQNPPPPDPETLKAQTQLQIAQIDSQTKLQLAGIEHQIWLMRIAAEQKVSIAKIQSDLQKAAVTTDSKERLAAAEIGLKQRMGSGI